MNERKFHFSIDDVLPSLIEVTDKNISLKDHPFFRDLWKSFKQYGLKTGLYVFHDTKLHGRTRRLSEVHNLQRELEEGWLFFGPHALNPETAPYDQTIDENITALETIYSELDRIAGPFICQSVRLHYHSECYELANFFKERGVTELLTTDKPIGLHRFSRGFRTEMLKNGALSYNGFNFRRSHLRIENLANDNRCHDEFVNLVEDILSKHEKLVLYSHEYEHSRSTVVDYFHRSMQCLHEDLNFISEHP